MKTHKLSTRETLFKVPSSLNLPAHEKIRVSIGTAIVLKLIHGRLDAKPTTAYLLTFNDGKCSANCGFCPQAKGSKGRADMLSRVTWPSFHVDEMLAELENAVLKGLIKRVCVQTLNYPKASLHLLNLVKKISLKVDVPISVSCQPLKKVEMRWLKKAGVERISVPIDAATEELFERVKGKMAGGSYVWGTQRKALLDAVEVFGKGFVSTHLIVGLGESEKDMVRIIQWCKRFGVYPALFAFTPIQGTRLEKQPQPGIANYRRIQMARFLVLEGSTRFEKMKFDSAERIVDFAVPKTLLREVAESAKPFLTSGCPNCNRPYYNESPGGIIYNYAKGLTSEEIEEVKGQLRIFSDSPDSQPEVKS